MWSEIIRLFKLHSLKELQLFDSALWTRAKQQRKNRRTSSQHVSEGSDCRSKQSTVFICTCHPHCNGTKLVLNIVNHPYHKCFLMCNSCTGHISQESSIPSWNRALTHNLIGKSHSRLWRSCWTWWRSGLSHVCWLRLEFTSSRDSQISWKPHM